MFDQYANFTDWVATLSANVLSNLGGLLGPHSRLYLPYLLIALTLALVAFLANRKHFSDGGKSGFFAYLFNPTVYFQRSSLVDLKIILANRLFTPFFSLATRAATIVSAHAVASFFVSAETLTGSVTTVEVGFATLAAITILVTLSSDFTTYWVHRAFHESPIFWPFHKLHHSAETLTPITFARKHPVYDLIRGLSNAFIVGPMQGIVFALFGVGDIVTILGVNAIYAVFHWSGSNLRHSHVWLSYGPFWNRIFISPCQHQIHHSCAAKHHDKNYGEIFAFWDGLFGTLYVPDGYEKLVFGVGDSDGKRMAQAHPSLKDAYLVPFKECAAALAARNSDPDGAENANPAA